MHQYLDKAYFLISAVLWRLLMLVQTFFFLRMALLFFKANPQTLVVKELYEYTGILVRPFAGIFPNATVWGGEIDAATAAAMAGYCLGLYIIERLLRLFHFSHA